MAASAITLHSGKLGAGKTLKFVIDAVETWRRGGYVYSNVAFKWPECKEYVRRKYGKILRDEQFVELKPSQIPRFFEHVRRGTRSLPVKVCIDEAGKYFNARNWAKNDLQTADSIREMRKLHIDLTFICQDEDFLDKQFRLLFNYHMKCRDFAKFRIPVLGNYLLFNCYDDETGVKVGALSKWWRKDPEIYEIYETDALVSDYAIADMAELEQLELEEVKPEQKFTMKGFVIIFCCLGFLAYSTAKWWWPFGRKSSESVAKAGSSVPAGGKVVQASDGKALYDMQVERLRYRWNLDGREVLATEESGEFEVGELSRYGMVEKIWQNKVLVRTPEGRALYVLAQRRNDTVEELRKKLVPFESSVAAVK